MILYSSSLSATSLRLMDDIGLINPDLKPHLFNSSISKVPTNTSDDDTQTMLS